MPSALARPLRRIRQMSARELRHRTSATLRRYLGWLPLVSSDRDDDWVARMLGDATSRAALPEHLRRVLAVRLYGHAWTPASLADALVRAGVADSIVREADAICDHRLRVLGYGVQPAGADFDWHRDLVTGTCWPRRYWGFMTVGTAEGWDPKRIWEPSRHQHFQVLAAAAVLTGDHRYADELADQLAGWIAQNPPRVGIHWTESLEPALRLLAWLWALPLVLDTPRFTPELCASLLRSVVAQARHIAAHLSVYASPNTHLIGEALALFVVGTVLPELEAATAWREQGRAILEREIVVQVGDDGVYREASLYYHAYAVEFYLIAAVMAARNGVALAPVVGARLERMLEALAWLVRPDGTLPNIGDADGGRVLRLGGPSLQSVHELLASGAAWFERADLRAGLAASGAEAAFLLPDAPARLARLGWAPPLRGARQFPDARLAVERRRVGGAARVVLFDAGDLGMLNGAHGHAGCLGLEIHADGQPLVVDRGTYVYNAAPAWRAYFRGTRAHSTVALDGADQAQAGTPFTWTTRYRSRLVRHGATPEYTVVTGEHDGYERLPHPVRHRRTVVSAAGEYWVCIDVLEGRGTHQAEFLWHLAPGLDVTVDGTRAFAAPTGSSHGVLIVAAGFASAASRVVAGATDPIQGWHSDDYGEKRPAPTLVTTETLPAPAVRVHVLAPSARAAERDFSVETDRVGDDGLVLRINGAGFADLVFCAPSPRRFEVGGVEFTGELLHARASAAGALQRSLVLRATELRDHGVSRLSTDATVDWMATVYEPAGDGTAGERGVRAERAEDGGGRQARAFATVEGS